MTMPVTCGCDAPHYALGLCQKHYSRHRHDVRFIPKPPRQKNLSGCSVSGCPGEFHAHGLCQRHYQAHKRRLQGRPPPRPYYYNPLTPKIEELALTMTQSQIAKFLKIGRMVVIGVVYRARNMGRLPDPKAKVYVPREFPPPSSCLWMDGDPQDPAAHFCGEPVLAIGSAWCAAHRRRVYLRVNIPSPEQIHALEAAAAAN